MNSRGSFKLTHTGVSLQDSLCSNTYSDELLRAFVAGREQLTTTQNFDAGMADDTKSRHFAISRWRHSESEYNLFYFVLFGFE